MGQNNRLTKEEIKRDRFIESTLKASAFLKSNRKSILVALAVVIIGVAIVWGVQDFQRRQRTQAAADFNQALEKYQAVEENRLDIEKVDESLEQLRVVGAQFKEVFQKYPGTSFADKARYNYAKTLYYLEDYPGARTHFQLVVETHAPENQIVALHAQQAVGNCYEQEREYAEAIEAYHKNAYPPTPKVPEAVREFVLANSRFNQALCYENLGRISEALELYQDLVDEFRNNLELAIEQKSLELIPEAKKLIGDVGIAEVLVTPEAERLETEGRYYDAFLAYFYAVRDYKVQKDIDGGLTQQLRGQIRKFETRANLFTKNLKDARRYEAESGDSAALYYYDQAVGLDFVPTRNLYAKALLRRDKHELARK